MIYLSQFKRCPYEHKEEFFMKKRLFKGIIATVAALSMTVSVMAAGSIVGAIDMPKASSSAGRVTLSKVESDTYEPELQAVVDKLNNAPAGTTVADAFVIDLSQIDLYDAEGLKIENVDMGQYKFLSPVMDLQIIDVVPTQENPVRVTFVANNMTDNIDVDVLHYCEEHKWEVLQGEKISSNEVAADFHSASPVALIYKEKPAATVDTDKKAPQTGERTVWPMAVAVVALLGVGVFAVKKSKKAAC